LNYVILLHAITLLPGCAGRTVLLVATFRRVQITDVQYKYRYRRVSAEMNQSSGNNDCLKLSIGLHLSFCSNVTHRRMDGQYTIIIPRFALKCIAR